MPSTEFGYRLKPSARLLGSIGILSVPRPEGQAMRQFGEKVSIQSSILTG